MEIAGAAQHEARDIQDRPETTYLFVQMISYMFAWDHGAVGVLSVILYLHCRAWQGE